MSAQVYSLLGQTEGERKPFLGGCKKWGHIVRLTPRDLVAIRDEKVPPFVKFGIILPLLYFLLDPLTKSWRGMDIMINLWIDSRTYQKQRIMLSARQRSSDSLNLSKQNVFGQYDAVTLTMLYLKVVHDVISQNY